MIKRRASEVQVVDVGSRYGTHPTWKTVEGLDVTFHLFEPDPEEFSRLQEKYQRPRGNNKFVINPSALGRSSGELKLKLLANRAMSGIYERFPTRQFSGEKEADVLVSADIVVEQTTVDGYCKRLGVRPDFIKIDTEGHELEVLLGAQDALSESILGARVEASFNNVFKGGSGYLDIAKFLSHRGFSIVNIDYAGQGELQHPFTSARNRYGILDIVDTVWIRSKFVRRGKLEAEPSTLLKVALFSLLNHAPDLALALLEENLSSIKNHIHANAHSSLVSELALLVEKHFYTLKWEPNQSVEAHADWYHSVFGVQLRSGTKYMESNKHNP
jgi:FkbM family methyltransferase